MSKAKKPGKKMRADDLAVQRGFADDRAEAERLIMAGKILADNRPVLKPGQMIAESAQLRAKERGRFVGRGGEKLDAALNHFGIDVTGIVAIDIGSSTGGFTDCLLQRGARKVYAIDVGTNQLDWKLRIDPRVVVEEGLNAKDLRMNADRIFGREVPNFLVADLSYISLRSLLPEFDALLPLKSSMLLLVKPQFELARDQIELGGVVRDVEQQLLACNLVSQVAHECGLRPSHPFASPVTGQKKGNQEYFLLVVKE